MCGHRDEYVVCVCTVDVGVLLHNFKKTRPLRRSLAAPALNKTHGCVNKKLIYVTKMYKFEQNNT